MPLQSKDLTSVQPFQPRILSQKGFFFFFFFKAEHHIPPLRAWILSLGELNKSCNKATQDRLLEKGNLGVCSLVMPVNGPKLCVAPE